MSQNINYLTTYSDSLISIIDEVVIFDVFLNEHNYNEQLEQLEMIINLINDFKETVKENTSTIQEMFLKEIQEMKCICTEMQTPNIPNLQIIGITKVALILENLQSILCSIQYEIIKKGLEN